MLKVVYYIFIACIAAIAILLVISAFPITGNFKILVVQSGSMESAIHTGAVVAIKPAAEYKVGDIITFGQMSKTKTPTTHRIFEIKDVNGSRKFVTKGDANNGPDAREITQSEILGKVWFSIPYAGYAVDAAKKPVGFMLIIIVPAIIIIYDEIRKIIDEAKKIRNRSKNPDPQSAEESKEG